MRERQDNKIKMNPSLLINILSQVFALPLDMRFSSSWIRIQFMEKYITNCQSARNKMANYESRFKLTRFCKRVLSSISMGYLMPSVEASPPSMDCCENPIIKYIEKRDDTTEFWTFLYAAEFLCKEAFENTINVPLLSGYAKGILDRNDNGNRRLTTAIITVVTSVLVLILPFIFLTMKYKDTGPRTAEEIPKKPKNISFATGLCTCHQEGDTLKESVQSSRFVKDRVEQGSSCCWWCETPRPLNVYGSARLKGGQITVVTCGICHALLNPRISPSQPGDSFQIKGACRKCYGLVVLQSKERGEDQVKTNKNPSGGETPKNVDMGEDNKKREDLERASKDDKSKPKDSCEEKNEHCFGGEKKDNEVKGHPSKGATVCENEIRDDVEELSRDESEEQSEEKDSGKENHEHYFGGEKRNNLDGDPSRGENQENLKVCEDEKKGYRKETSKDDSEEEGKGSQELNKDNNEHHFESEEQNNLDEGHPSKDENQENLNVRVDDKKKKNDVKETSKDDSDEESKSNQDLDKDNKECRFRSEEQDILDGVHPSEVKDQNNIQRQSKGKQESGKEVDTLGCRVDRKKWVDKIKRFKSKFAFATPALTAVLTGDYFKYGLPLKYD